ncbi:hypothetical protein LshimejAT787_1900790 [Lyophyllum shimeji]|uniref:Uncharacterized protein n=1 Tax=Lyophyllum shimeji TaxID=47721 RepID=A0A9P3Q1K5_LYOSH|nr:hypothetical protein LshimejAT787_1900790 [Lyophyllum shimeji]
MRLNAICILASVIPALFAFAAPLPDIEDDGLVPPPPVVDPTPSITVAFIERAATPTATATSNSSDSCPLYTAADAAHLSARDIREYEKRVGEELWFRFDDPSVASGGKNFLPPTKAKGGKDFDDQAYKWLSTDISKVERGKIPKRNPTMYVLPAGTRDSIFAAAQDFETTSSSKQRADFVFKDNERGDVGIQAVSPGASSAVPLDTFRDQVIRVVTKSTSDKAGGKATFTTIGADGKTTKGASKSDQAALSGFC